MPHKLAVALVTFWWALGFYRLDKANVNCGLGVSEREYLGCLVRVAQADAAADVVLRAVAVVALTVAVWNTYATQRNSRLMEENTAAMVANTTVTTTNTAATEVNSLALDVNTAAALRQGP